MFYGDDYSEIITNEDVRFISCGGLVVSEDKLFLKLVREYLTGYGHMSYRCMDTWVADNPDAVYDCLCKLENEECRSHNVSADGCHPFGLSNTGLIEAADELYIEHDGKVAKFNDVYDELELIWEAASGHHVDDDGGYEFEEWCKNNAGIVIQVMSRHSCELMGSE